MIIHIYNSYTPCHTRIAVDKSNEDLECINSKSRYMMIGTINQTPTIGGYGGILAIRVAWLGNEPRNLDLIMDEQLYFEIYVLSTDRNCFYRLYESYNIRNYLLLDIRIKFLSEFNYKDVVYKPRLLTHTQKLIHWGAQFYFIILPRILRGFLSYYCKH